MAEVLPLSENELRLLESLIRHKIRFMVVGLSAAAHLVLPVLQNALRTVKAKRPGKSKKKR